MLNTQADIGHWFPPISRSGEPQWEAVTGSPTTPSWARRVSWERADVFRPDTYAPLFRGANYAVHSLGILLEADYKGVLSGRDSPLEGVRKILAPGGQGSPGPRPPGRPVSGKPSTASSPTQMTYEAMNRDSALLVARAAADAGVDAFAYISAAAGAPVLPARYIGSKREAEQLLTAAAASPSPSSSSFPQPLHRPVFVRAPFLYDAAARPLTVPLAALVGAGALFNRATGGLLSGLLGSAGTKPLKADDVADAVIEALSDDTVHGAVEVSQLVQLADRAWRKSML